METGEQVMDLMHYGLQRSGTNYLEALLKRKYRVRFLNSNASRSQPEQKHFRLYDQKDIVPEPQYRNELKVEDFSAFERLLRLVPEFYLIISKDPYSWLLSYKKWAAKCDWPEVSYHYIREYGLFYGKWLELSRQTEKIVFVRYIDILQRPNEELSRLEEEMGLREKRFSAFVTSPVSKVDQSGVFAAEGYQYYVNEEYLKDYDKDELDAVNELLDKEVVRELGYKPRWAT